VKHKQIAMHCTMYMIT